MNSHKLVRHSRVFVTRKKRKIAERKEDPPVAVIGSAPHGHDCSVKHEFVSFHRELMGARNEVNRVVVRESLGDISTEQEPSAPRR